MTILHQIGDLLRDALSAIPLGLVRVLFVALPAAVLIWVLTLPRSETSAPEVNGQSGANLKWGAALALGVQIVIYALL